MLTYIRKIKLANHLYGIAFSDWLRHLQDNRFNISARYLARALAITAVSIFNSGVKYFQEKQFENRIKPINVDKPPVFILGHWGSGTTYLHKLLSLDPHFTYPNLYQVLAPNTFLYTEKYARKFLTPYITGTRLWDNVPFDLNMPMEDELAICMTSGMSPYLSWAFPQREQYYDRYLTLNNVSTSEKTIWADSLLNFIKMIYWQENKPVLLKSPTHTARIQFLLEVFPDAHFIHIHRHPFNVYKSTLNFYLKAMPYFSLQKTDPEIIKQGIIKRHVQMYEAFFAQRQLIPKGNYCDVQYERLASEPLQVLKDIYKLLQLNTFNSAYNNFEEYVTSNSDYKNNQHTELTENEKQLISNSWHKSFSEWDYKQ